MRLLLAVSHSNMAAQELYLGVLRARYPGWGVSHMSGLPRDPASIISAYDAVIYELYPPEDPRRYKDLLALLEESEPSHKTPILTSIDGPYRAGIVATLEEKGVYVVGNPLSVETVSAALDLIAPPVKNAEHEGANGGDRRGFLGLFKRRS